MFNFNLSEISLSPKVYGPLIVGLAGVVVTWIATGHFDGKAAEALIATAILTGIGYISPHAKGVKHIDVVNLSHLQRNAPAVPPAPEKPREREPVAKPARRKK